MFVRIMLSVVASGALLAGCVDAVEGEDAFGSVPASIVQATTCGEKSWPGPDGKTIVEPTIYRFAVLDADLAAHPEVASAIGFKNVATCDQARIAAEALLAEAEAEVPELDDTLSFQAPDSKGEDEQSLMGGTEYKTRRGLVYINGSCTAFLVGPRVAVTAAHCLDQYVSSGNSGTTRNLLLYYLSPSQGGPVRIANFNEDLTVHIHPNWSAPEEDRVARERDRHDLPEQHRPGLQVRAVLVTAAAAAL